MDQNLQKIIIEKDTEIKLLHSEIEDLKNQLFHFNHIFESVPGSVYWKDKDGFYRGQNQFSKNAMREAGLEPNMIGKTDYDLFSAETADLYRKNDLSVMKNEQSVAEEEMVTLPNGKKIMQVSLKKPLFNKDGSIYGIIGNTVDITKLKETEEKLRLAKEEAELASELKTDFIHNMEHDIRTPLAGIYGLGQLLLKNEKDKQKTSYLTEIVGAAKELLDDCTNLLEFSKMEFAEQAVINKKFDLKKTLQHVLTIEKPSAEVKKLSLKLEFSAEIPTVIIGDEFRISKILLNLLGNAIKFTSSGFVKIDVQAGQKIDKRHFVLILSVHDTGKGIDHDKQNMIFEKFAKGTPSNRGGSHGMGLGLYIVKRFVEDLDGDIEVYSQKGEGTTFVCSIPIKIPLISEFLQE